jgi:arylsulfatase A-like enzyme
VNPAVWRRIRLSASIGLCGWIACWTFSFPRSATAAKSLRPNIILILADDQGWNGTSVEMIPGDDTSRSDFYQTPRLEALAARGMVFSDAYSSSPVCSPSRYSIQHGMSPLHLGKLSNDGYKLPLAVETDAIPRVLAGIDPSYVSAHFGKWHMYGDPGDLGYQASDGPTDNVTGGFETRDQRKYEASTDPKLMDAITDRGIAFMETQVEQGRPFYLQVSHYAVHLDVQARAETLERYERASPGKVHSAFWYAAMTEDLDGAVGRLLDHVDALGIADHTYIFYMSDNGALAKHYPSINHPLRAGKLTLYEGGIRVPLVVAGPGIEAGSHSRVPVAGLDLLPTFAALAGGRSWPESVEGGSLKDVLEGTKGATVKRPREGLFFRFRLRENAAVVRMGELKLKQNFGQPPDELFDLSADVSERTNLFVFKPMTAARLQVALDAWLKPRETVEPE